MGNKKAKQKAGTNSTYSLEQLQAKHAQCDVDIKAEEDFPRPDQLKIRQLKKLKLIYKEQIEKKLLAQQPVSEASRHDAKVISLPPRVKPSVEICDSSRLRRTAAG